MESINSIRSQSLLVLKRVLDLKEDSVDESKTKKRARLTDLLKRADDEVTSDWFMCVPPCFNEALDIKKTQRTINKEETLFWTQGSSFFFNVGDTIYNNSKAYSVWSEALKHFTLCVQVDRALGATPAKINKEKNEQSPRNPGMVFFTIYTPNEIKTSVVKLGEYKLTQDDFVSFLIDGPKDKLKDEIPWKL